MPDPTRQPPEKAVFISYASQDAEAARRIAEALRAAGVEVWFDQNELRGGDAWDQKIRKQIKECTLFIPVISRMTQERLEGYFRREWRMGVERMADMDDNMPFLFPVTIDDAGDSAVRVPERFYERQWTKLPGGETPSEFAERVRRIVNGEPEPQSSKEAMAELASASLSSEAENPIGALIAKRPWILAVVGVAALLVVIGIWRPWHSARNDDPAVASQRTPAGRSGTPASPTRSEAGRLVERAREITQALGLSRAQIDAAAALCERALKIDPSDAKVWIEAARTDMLMVYPTKFDRSDDRRKQAQERAARAVSLAPDSMDAQIVQAAVLAHAVGTPALLDEAEKTFRRLLAANPGDRELTIRLAEVLREKKKFADAGAMFEQIGEHEYAGWCYFEGGNSSAALAAVQRSLANEHSVAALQLSAILQSTALENLDSAQTTIAQILPSELLAERPAAVALKVAMFKRDPDRMLQIAQALTRDFMDSSAFRGPRQYFTGLAHEIAGQKDTAAADWRAGLAVVDEQLKTSPDDHDLLLMSAWLQAALGERRKAEKLLSRAQAVAGLKSDAVDATNAGVYLRMGKTDQVLAWLTSTLKANPPMWEVLHAEARFSPDYDGLRKNRKFDTLLRETMPPGAPPIPELPPEEKPKSFWSRLTG